MFKVNPDTCVGCEECVEDCPVNAISMQGEGDDKKAIIDQEECIECGTCETVCSHGAIKEED